MIDCPRIDRVASFRLHFSNLHDFLKSCKFTGSESLMIFSVFGSNSLLMQLCSIGRRRVVDAVRMIWYGADKISIIGWNSESRLGKVTWGNFEKSLFVVNYSNNEKTWTPSIKEWCPVKRIIEVPSSKSSMISNLRPPYYSRSKASFMLTSLM